MHRNRRQMGEAWLFEDGPTKDQSKAASGKDNARRRMPLFRSFAANSQFTQGFEGYRLHRLLHQVRLDDHQSQDIPEAATFYQITEFCTTMRRQTQQTTPAKKSVKSTKKGAKK